MKSLIRIKKTGLEKNKDFVETDPRMPMVLSDWIKENIPDYEHFKVLDPCSGNGIIWKGLLNVFYNITYFDKYMGRKRGNYLLRKCAADIITFNPPYSAKYKFIDKAIKEARYVFCLLPLNVSNYLCIHADYENQPDYIGRIKMSPKIDLNTGKQGGNSMYCWYIWDKENNTKTGLEWYYDLRDYMV